MKKREFSTDNRNLKLSGGEKQTPLTAEDIEVLRHRLLLMRGELLGGMGQMEGQAVLPLNMPAWLKKEWLHPLTMKNKPYLLQNISSVTSSWLAKNTMTAFL